MSKKHAHPLCALMRADRRMLWRHGIVGVYLLLMLLYVAAARFLATDDTRQTVTTLLLLTDPATLSLMFMGVIVLYEKNQRVHAALYAAAVRPGTYVLAKCIVMAVFGTLVGCVIVWFASPNVLSVAEGQVAWETVLDGDVLTLCVTAGALLVCGVLATCAGVALASVCKSINGFLLMSILAEVVLLAPAIVDLFVPLPAWASYHPLVWAERMLMQPTDILAFLQTPAQWAYAGAFVVWLVVLYLLARAGAKRLLRAGAM